MAVPAKQNFSITRGDTETVVVNITSDGATPINITGRTYRAQLRSTKESPAISASFVCTITNALQGQVTAVLSAATTGTLSAGTYYWDFEEDNSGVITTIIAGTVSVLADVTR
jgi:hypothetical protein